MKVEGNEFIYLVYLYTLYDNKSPFLANVCIRDVYNKDAPKSNFRHTVPRP